MLNSEFVFQPLAILYFFVGVIDLIVAGYCWRRRATKGSGFLALLMVAVAEYAFSIMYELISVGIPTKVFWSSIAYIGSMSSTPLLVMFSLAFTQNDRFLKFRYSFILWIIPIITTILVFTNEQHNLIWTSFTPNPVSESNILVYGHGTWFWIAMSYIFLLTLLSMIILIIAAINTKPYFRKQIISILPAFPVSWLFVLAYVFQWIPIPGFDATPLAFSIVGFIIMWSVFRFGFLDIVPIAHKKLIESMKDGLIVLDENERIVDINPAGEALFNLEQSEVIGTPLETISELQKIRHGSNGNRLEMLKDDTKLYFSVSSIPLINEKQSQVGRMLVFQDISKIVELTFKLEKYSRKLEEMVMEQTLDLQKASHELKQKDQLAMLGQLAGSVSHELRNPLATISNAVYFLNMTLTDVDENIKEYLEMMDHEVNKARKIISDLLDFSKTPVSERANREKTDISGIINQVIEKNPAPENVTNDIDIPTDLPAVYTDQIQVSQILTNLISNAYQAMTEGGSLSISAAQPDDSRVQLTIKDTGVGISEEQLPHIFQPLFTTRRNGIGLGLAITKNLVETNEGTITVESKVGEGTSFIVTLPIYTS